AAGGDRRPGHRLVPPRLRDQGRGLRQRVLRLDRLLLGGPAGERLLALDAGGAVTARIGWLWRRGNARVPRRPRGSGLLPVFHGHRPGRPVHPPVPDRLSWGYT